MGRPFSQSRRKSKALCHKRDISGRQPITTSSVVSYSKQPIRCCVDPQVEALPIHDRSFPETSSKNDYFDVDCAPDIEYISVVAVARRTETLSRTHPGIVIKMLTGDVKSAFHHLMLHAEHLRWIGATFPAPKALVIDLVAPFGWSGSPAF